MTIDDVLVLAKAGFSSTQIAAMQMAAGPDPAPVSQDVQQQPALAPAPAPAPAQPAAQPAAPAPDPTAAKLDQILSLFQAQAGMQPQPPAPSADQILAEIIAPQAPKP